MLRSAAFLVVVVGMGWVSLARGDGANTIWKAVKLPDAVAGRTLHGVFFLDAKQGWVVGEQHVQSEIVPASCIQ